MYALPRACPHEKIQSYQQHSKKILGLSAVIRPSTLCCPFARWILPLSAVIRYGDCWFTFIYRKAEFLAVGRSFDDRSYALNLRALCILP